jgi:multidrug efflux pump subunit AcrA (membrane-fusion protein)
MKKSGLVRLLPGAVLLVAVTLAVAAWTWWPGRSGTASYDSAATVTVRRGTFVRTVRVAGTTEAVRAAAAIAPRLAGQSSPTLVITHLVKGGSRVRAGDVLVEFDPQDQIRAAFDRRTEYQDLEQQIRRLEAEQAAARAADETAVKQAENDVGRAQLDARKNRVLPAIEAEKNTLALEEAEARLVQVRQARALRRRTAEADMRILEIRRERSERALQHAEHNTGLMVVRAPFEGLAVVQAVFKGSQMTEVQEGDEVRPGMPIVNVVDPSRMQVRARVSQVDGGSVSVGQAARVSLDAYPGLVFNGHVAQFAPLAIVSSLTPAVRGFVAVINIEGTDANLMPDLSAAVDIGLDRRENALLVPRDAVAIDAGGAWVRLRRGSSFVRQTVVLGEISADHAVVVSGVAEGAILARRPREAW